MRRRRVHLADLAVGMSVHLTRPTPRWAHIQEIRPPDQWQQRRAYVQFYAGPYAGALDWVTLKPQRDGYETR